MKIAILGSCVTRDGFELHKELLRPGYYFARTSLASVFADKPSFPIDLGGMKSKFQRAMVERDTKKTFRKFLTTKPIDLLIYDPIDERFNLLINQQRSEICTLSTEFLSAKIDIPECYRIIRSGSSVHYALWEKGWVQLVEILKKRKLLHVLKINRVKWATQFVSQPAGDMQEEKNAFEGLGIALRRFIRFDRRLSHARSSESSEVFLPSYSNADIENANELLEKMYTRMSQDLSEEQFFVFSKEMFISDAQHRWGKSPFHYVPEYYSALMEQVLEALGREGQQSDRRIGMDDFELDATYEKGVITARIVTNNNVAKNAKFAFYLLVNGQRKIVSHYSERRIVKFRLVSSGEELEVMGFLLNGHDKLIKRKAVLSKS
ncbi:hypothetical protein W822_04205 [Advenella kashmirensis W13003]|uniref:Uncharacterized protein n=1 Tax=Advenella kashmirensis W13003 TaxID=1424334 RepID=V8R0C4_9BURK|nr:DUF6270 domain-containing protein [Advenella kashmirensis]ETF04724.1 hypothetical protein W822_04205 [Advenella kashmirensis W13003]